MFSIDPSKPYAASVNFFIKISCYMSRAALANQVQQAYPGDPLVGTVLQGSNPPLKWEDATPVQQAIYEWYTEGGQVTDNIGPELTANVGPFLPWNYSYTQWGLPGALIPAAK